MFVPKKSDKEVISIRISSDMLKKIDDAAIKYDLSRNELINQCIAFALENLKKENEPDDQ